MMPRAARHRTRPGCVQEPLLSGPATLDGQVPLHHRADEEEAMLSWGTILYGAALSGLLAAVLVAVTIRPRRPSVVATAAVSALLAPVAWNAILRATHARQFFTDAPIAVMPASWQDVGSGVFTIAATALALGLGPLAGAPARRAAIAAVLTGAAAFLVDVYLY
jgi:hypothetical protein